MKPKKVFNKDGSYRWLIDYYDDKGKRVKRRFKKLSDAETVAAQVVVAKKEGKYGEIFGRKQEPVFLFNDLVRDYLATCHGQRSFEDKRLIVEKVLQPKFGETPLVGITYRELELFRSQRLQVRTRQGRERSQARVNREMAALRHMLNKAVQWGKLMVNPFEKGESLFFREDKNRIRYLTEEEADCLLASCQLHLRPIVETALNTGMRKGEILAMRWDWLRDGWIHIPAEMSKTGKGRMVPVNESQAQVFAELRRQVQLKSPHVFCDDKGRAWKLVRKSFAAAVRRAGIVNFRFHDLRHTCASWLVMAGADLVSVQKQLGHTSIETTMRYAHLAPGHLKKSSNLIRTRRPDGNISGTSAGFKARQGR
ncbi:MAG: tyrosine-type recombinase/integrase [Desulfobaccales bacterium]